MRFKTHAAALLRVRIWTSTLILIAAGRAFLIAPPAQADVQSPTLASAAPDLSSPKRAGLVFARALEDGDAKLLRQACFGSDAEFAQINAVGETWAALRRYEDAASAKFGNPGKLTFATKLSAEVEAAVETVHGNRATLVHPVETEGTPRLILRKDGAIWKLDLASVAPLANRLKAWVSDKCPRYTSTGLIEVRTRNELLAVADAAHRDGFNAGELEVEKATQANLLLHDGFLTALLKNNAAIAQTEWFKQFVVLRNGQKTVDFARARADLLSRVIVRAVPASRLISVKFSGPNPNDCQTIVTAIVDQRIVEHKAEIDSDHLEKAHGLQVMKQNYELQIRETSERMGAIAAELGRMGVGIDSGLTNKDFELQQLVSEAVKARDFETRAIEKLAVFRKQLETNSAPELETAMEKNAFVAEYRHQIDAMEIEVADAAATFGAENAKTVAIRRRLDAARKKLADTTDEIKARTVTLIVANLEDDVSAGKDAMDRIAVRMMAVREELAVISKRRTDYKDLSASLATLGGKLNHIVEEQDKLALLDLTMRTPPINWAARPDLPDHVDTLNPGKAAADAIDAVALDVEAGKYKTADEALAAIGIAVERAMASRKE